MCHTLFVEHIVKFKDKITSEDDRFFLEYCEDKEKRDVLKQQSSGLLDSYKVNV